MKTRIITVTCLTIFALMSEAVATEPQRDRIRVAVIGTPLGTLPTTHFHAPGKLLVQHIAETLVAYRDDLSIAPSLADSWNVSEDGRTYRFLLRGEARFHNNERLLAEHIVANWQELYLNPEFDWDCRSYFDGTGSIEERTTGVEIETITAIDEETVEFRLSKPNSLFLHRLADVSCGPVVFHPESFDSKGYWKSLIGTGPFYFADGKQNDSKRITLKRFDGYQPRPEQRDGYSGARDALLEEVHLLIYPSTDEAIIALQSNEVDYVQGIDATDRESILANPALAVATSSNVTYWTLLFQTNDAVIADPLLRLGIAKAIDTNRVAAAISDHRSAGNASVISPQSEYYSDSQANQYGHDMAAARSLVRQSGYGGELVTIQCSRDVYPDSCKIAGMARAMMRDAGVNTEISPMSWKTLKDDKYMQGRYQMQAFIIGGRTTPTLAFGKFIGSKASNPRIYWDNPVAFKLLEEIETAPPGSDLQSFYDSLHTMMLEDIPQIIIMNREQHDAYRLGFKGIQPTHFGRIAFWGVSHVDE